MIFFLIVYCAEQIDLAKARLGNLNSSWYDFVCDGYSSTAS